MRLSSGFVRCIAVVLLTLFLALAPAIPAHAATSGSGGSFWSAALTWIQGVFSASSSTTSLPDDRHALVDLG